MDEISRVDSYDSRRARRFLRPWALRRLWHRADLRGAERLPKGPAILVSNHGRLDFDSLILLKMIADRTGKLPRSLGERMLFRNPLTAKLAAVLGTVEGTRSNVVTLLAAGEWVLSYPGGIREIFDSRFGRERVCWTGRRGFAHVALRSGVPVVPIASVGVNHGFVFLGDGQRLGRFMARHVLRFGADQKDFRDPFAIGILPLPLPFSTAVHFPLPCKVRYLIGEPLTPPALPADERSAADAFASRVETALCDLLATHATPDPRNPA